MTKKTILTFLAVLTVCLSHQVADGTTRYYLYVASSDAPSGEMRVDGFYIWGGCTFAMKGGWSILGNCPPVAEGPMAMAWDEGRNLVFISYEYTNLIQVFDATDFTLLGGFTVPDVDNLAGLAFYKEMNTLYVAERGGNRIWLYYTGSDPTNPTPVLSSPRDMYLAFGVGGIFGIAMDDVNHDLYVADWDETVHVFDSPLWVELNEITVGHGAVGIAVDGTGGTANGIDVFTTSYTRTWPWSINKHNTKTSTNTLVTTEYPPGGIAVSPDTRCVFVTEGTPDMRGRPAIVSYDYDLTKYQTTPLPTDWQVTDVFVRKVVFEDSWVCMDSTSTLPGHAASIRLNMRNIPQIGGLNFRICYDRSGLNLISAEPRGVIADWEYFTYRMSYLDNCGSGCPSGYLRVIGLADLPDGNTPDEAVFAPEGNIAELTFQTTEDLSFVGQCFPLDYCWNDCGDNTISSPDGNWMYMTRHLAELDLEQCLIGDKDWLPDTLLNFCRGVICIIPPSDDRGDVNLNGVANEIADAVLLSNYFILGPGVWDPAYAENQILASDVNDDGTPHTIADLVYLIRIITGDAIPYGESGEGGKAAALTNTADLDCTVGENMVVSSYSPVSVGGAAFIFRHAGEIGIPELSDEAAAMTLRYSDRNGELRVLMFSMELNTIEAGGHDLFTLPLNGNTIELVEAQFSDADGNLLAVNTDKIAPPTEFVLMQNYPNPFNSSTSISFALPVAADWSLGVYNIAGQLVKEFNGHNDAGMVNLRWAAPDAPSGIYLYKLKAGSFEDTRKMTLIK